ncbi:hypothetical protein [Streptomyces cynarae]|uniref:hypothetical protein n=1 Tax=Streptomyces cynarae TaxID=2981134 RepID=UPI0028BE6C16|nr:hypothetical protein [Streptomyces cynarae]
MRRPKAAAVRGSCSCGWRGHSYPIDWDTVKHDRLDELDFSGPYDDWCEHIRAVEHQTMPLPAELTQLMDQLEEQLTALAEQAPAAALKAVGRPPTRRRPKSCRPRRSARPSESAPAKHAPA